MATAVGDILNSNGCKRAVCLMTGATANTGSPGFSTDGKIAGSVPGYPDEPTLNSDTGAAYARECPRESTLLIRSTSGSGVMVGTFVLWGYMASMNEWFPMKVNAGVALAEYSADKILYTERITLLGHFDRFFLELQAVGGTTTTFEAWLVTGRQVS